MNKLLFLVLGFSVISIPVRYASAAEPMNVTFIQAINRGSLSWVDWYLKQGIDINGQVGGYKETPLMFAIRAFVKDAETRDTFGSGVIGIGKGVAWLVLAPSVTFLLGAVPSSTIPPLSFVVAGAIALEIAYGTVKILKGTGKIMVVVPLSAYRLYKRKKIIERLINHPAIDITILNNKNQAALDIIQHFMLLNVDNRKIFRTLKQIESMLLEKQRAPQNSAPSAEKSAAENVSTALNLNPNAFCLRRSRGLV